MSDQSSITLEPRKHGKLGVLHVGVTREGFVAVAGEVADIDDGQTLTFDRSRVSVTRSGSSYTFTKNS